MEKSSLPRDAWFCPKCSYRNIGGRNCIQCLADNPQLFADIETLRDGFIDAKTPSGFVCERCGSEQSMSCEMIWASGTTIGQGVAAGWGPGTGVVVAQSLNINTSILAAKVPPPLPPEDVGNSHRVGFGIYIIFALLLASKQTEASSMVGTFVVLMVIGGIIGYSIVQKNRQAFAQEQQEYRRKLDIWKHTFMCLRCGDTWLMNQDHSNT